MKNLKIILLAINCLIILLAVPAARGQTQGITYTKLGAFNNTNTGASPYNPPVLGIDGNLYGTSPGGGANKVGTIYKISTNGTQTTLYAFKTNNGANPCASLTPGRDGNLYGVAIAGGAKNQGTIFKITTNGIFTLLYSFGMMANALDGSSPYGALTQGRDGNFYGVTFSGGISNAGTVFQFSTNGTLTTLHSFTGDGGNDDGSHPFLVPLVEGADGVFYGTTYSGGTNNSGTIFQITADGTLTNLFEFNNADGNGTFPYSGLSLGTHGNLYGTTVYGGAYGNGTVFQISTNGVLTTLFHFGGDDGLYLPIAGVVPGNNDTLFGTTYYGGTKDYGAVFQLSTNGVLTTLHSFTNGSDGAYCYAGLTRDTDGNLYGAATHGGNKGGYGTVYSLRFSMLLSIFSPTANEFLSNDVFTVTGAASDNEPGRIITNVLYSLNDAAWTNPITTNNWDSWTTDVVLIPGTNTLQAFATDDNGKISATNTVKFVYFPSATLTVLTSGKGTVSPNYSNGLLQLGVNYSMTATPAAGVVFSNWTGGTSLPLTVITNKATLKFMMASNLVLQANFFDVTRPTLSITNVMAGMNVSNSVFNVTGKASDNVGVSNVFYSLNSAAWSSAVTTNGWTNWNAAVTLVPGTNTIAAYAVDTSGNVSTTNTLKLVYVVSATLTVSTNGKGTLSPAYNGALLQIGKSYSITATPASGFKFTNWTGGTSLPLDVLTNGATVKFLMASNLMLEASFIDTNKPTLSITAPTAGQRWSNAEFTVRGTAKDNWQVSNVWYQLNGSEWNNAATTNAWTNWTATVELAPGTNALLAYAVDTSGNFSTTNKVSLDYVVTSQLQIRSIGLGTIKPNYSNAWLEIGRSYSITSAPASGFVFTNWMVSTNWTGGSLVTGKNLRFLMQSNLTLQANFIDTNRPTLTIKSPTANQKMTNALVTLVGTAADNWQVSSVWYQLNSGEWNLGLTTNSYTNWTSPLLTLEAGTNSVSAYALDLGGNLSTTNRVNIVSSNAFLLELAFTISPPLTSTGLNFSVQLSPGLSGHVQFTTNLTDWAALTNFAGSTNTTLNFRDPAATNASQRFYRAVIP